MTEFEKLGLDAWLEKVEDEDARDIMRQLILAIEPVYGRPQNLWKNGYARWELPITGRTLKIRISVTE